MSKLSRNTVLLILITALTVLAGVVLRSSTAQAQTPTSYPRTISQTNPSFRLVETTAPQNGRVFIRVEAVDLPFEIVDVYKNGIYGGEDSVAPFFVGGDGGLSVTNGDQLRIVAYQDTIKDQYIETTITYTSNTLPSLGTITINSVGSNKSYTLDTLAMGKPVYIDRNYAFSAIPPLLNGATYIQTANDDKQSTGASFLNLSVTESVTVFVAYDSRLTLPTWLQNWQTTGLQLTYTSNTGNTESHVLYSKSFPAGQISLGGNFGSINESMYQVVILSAAAPSTPPGTIPPSPVASAASCQGDTNNDRVVNLLDYSILVQNFLKTPLQNPAADVTGDGQVNLFDYSIFVTRFLQPCL